MADQKLTDQELAARIREIIFKIGIEHAAHQKPEDSLEAVLAIKNITALRKLARALSIRGYTRMEHPEMVRAAAAALARPETLQQFLLLLDEAEWRFFREAAVRGAMQEDTAIIDLYDIPQEFGLIQSFYWQDTITFVVPAEIRAAYRSLAAAGFDEEKDFRDLLNDYAIAAVSLYGAIRPAELAEIYNKQNQRKTDADSLVQILAGYIRRDCGYGLIQGVIADDYFSEDDAADMRRLLRDAGSKPRYVPPREEFLRYADWDYYEETPAIRKLRRFLEKTLGDTDKAADLVDELHQQFLIRFHLQDCLDLLDEHGVVLKSEHEVGQFVQLLADASNNTRIWYNNGHTPNEIHKLMS